MEIAVLIPVSAILATAWVIVSIVRMRHERRIALIGSESGSGKQNQRLARENEDLKLATKRLEERLAVLERIATDPAERTAREIEDLRQR